MPDTRPGALAVDLDGVGMRFADARRRRRRARWPRSGDSGGLVHGRHRSQRQRQEHDPAPRRGPRGADERNGERRRARAEVRATVGSGSPSSSHGSFRGARSSTTSALPLELAGVDAAERRRASRGVARARRARRRRAPPSARAVGWDGAACRAGAGTDRRPGSPSPGRAIQRARRPDPGGIRRRAPAPLAREPPHDRPRHPQRLRGGDARRSRRRAGATPGARGPRRRDRQSRGRGLPGSTATTGQRPPPPRSGRHWLRRRPPGCARGPPRRERHEAHRHRGREPGRVPPGVEARRP